MRLAFASTLAILCGIGWVPSKGGGNDAGHQKEKRGKRKKDEDEKVRRERDRQLSSEKARPYALQRIGYDERGERSCLSAKLLITCRLPREGRIVHHPANEGAELEETEETKL